MNAIIDKIRKLRALSTSSNIHEAAAAAAAAERLIQEYNLAEADIDVSVAEDEAPVSNDAIADVGVRIATWRANLLSHLARAYQCSGLYAWKGGRYYYRAYGRAKDLELLRYQAAFFIAEITRLASSSGGKGRTWHNNFRHGAVSAIAEALQEAKAEARSTATSTALIVVDRRAEEAKLAKDYANPDLRSRYVQGYTFDHDAYHAGRRAGASINQRAVLDVGAAARRLIS